MPDAICWDCGGPAPREGWRCLPCKAKPARRERQSRHNQNPDHHGKERMFAGFALLRERMHGATVEEAIARVKPRFGRLDWKQIKCEYIAYSKSVASAERTSSSTTRSAAASAAGGKSSSNGAAHANQG